MAITYILLSQKLNRFYAGSSRENEVDKRLHRHNSGTVRSTKFGKPWIVVAVEKFGRYTDARKRELFLKSGIGRKIIFERFGYLKRK